jgi:hypothetical protein
MWIDAMFTDQEPLTFEERRDEVIAIVNAATDLAGAERGLRPFMDHLVAAADEHEFDDAYAALAERLSGSFLAVAGAA